MELGATSSGTDLDSSNDDDDDQIEKPLSI